MTKEEMLHAFRQRWKLEDEPDWAPWSYMMNENMAQFILAGIVPYDPELDLVQWIGPKPGSPEYYAGLRKIGL
jgi:hypothetical protein